MKNSILTTFACLAFGILSAQTNMQQDTIKNKKTQTTKVQKNKVVRKTTTTAEKQKMLKDKTMTKDTVSMKTK